MHVYIAMCTDNRVVEARDDAETLCWEAMGDKGETCVILSTIKIIKKQV